MTTPAFRFPDVYSRVAVTGQNGSGKTRFGIWLQGTIAQFDKRPYVYIDFKGDELIAAIHRKQAISLKDIPKHPGLYHLPLFPGQEIALEKWLWGIWERGNIGIYIDEGYQIPPLSKAYEAILTQGRSLRIPCMTLTQRPVRCSRFVFTEANYLSCFKLANLDDMKTASELVDFRAKEGVWSPYYSLPRFHSRWYDSANEFACELEPVPGDADILAIYDDKLRSPRRML